MCDLVVLVFQGCSKFVPEKSPTFGTEIDAGEVENGVCSNVPCLEQKRFFWGKTAAAKGFQRFAVSAISRVACGRDAFRHISKTAQER
jgi:hypothetical protein